MKTIEQIQHEDFNAAKKIALNIEEGCMRLAKNGNRITRYYGANVGGRMFVVGESLDDIQNPDAMIQGMPAREVYGEFTVMSK